MTVALRAAALIDGTGADPRPNSVIVIENGVIAAIARAKKGVAVQVKMRSGWPLDHAS